MTIALNGDVFAADPAETCADVQGEAAGGPLGVHVPVMQLPDASSRRCVFAKSTKSSASVSSSPE